MVHAGLGVDSICEILGLSHDALLYNVSRLHLPTPHERPRRRRCGRQPWSDDDVRLAIVWRCAGIHPVSIGNALGRSAGAVRSKLRRLGIAAPRRKLLVRVDPQKLDRSDPDFGFPAPPGELAVKRTENATVGAAQATNTAAPVAPTKPPPAFRFPEDPRPPSAPEPTASRVSDEEEPTDAIVETPDPDIFSVSVDPAVENNTNSERTSPFCKPADAPTLFVGPAELVERFRVAGKVPNPGANEPYLRWISLLHAGGMHYKAIAKYVGVSAPAMQSIMNRMQLPRDRKRSKFSWSCDLECGVATLDEWGYVFQRSTEMPELPVEERKLFWRPEKDKFNRKRRCARLNNKEIDEFWKYKATQYTSIITRGELDARNAAAKNFAVPTASEKVRLQAPMQLSLPIEHGGTNEQFTVRGRATAVRSGFSGNFGDEMPGIFPHNGGVAGAVAHP
jgi:hypothetical protein